MEKVENARMAIAHVRGDRHECQSLETHSLNVSTLCSAFAAKFGLSTHGELIGLLHDLGKYSHAFQVYIQSATNLLNQDEDEEFVDAAGLKGTIDHSTSGAQFIWAGLKGKSALDSAVGQMLALCIASLKQGPCVFCCALMPLLMTALGYAPASICAQWTRA